MFRAGWNHYHVALFQGPPLIVYFAIEFPFQHQQNLIAFLMCLSFLASPRLREFRAIRLYPASRAYQSTFRVTYITIAKTTKSAIAPMSKA